MEALRVRIGRVTRILPVIDDARQERKRALARERQRRRREAHPELRAKAADLERQRRRAKADLRKKAAEAQRRRRQAIPELRKKVTEAERQRKRADLEPRCRESGTKRRRRQANPLVRKKEVEAERICRQENPDLCEKSAQAKLAWMAANLDLFRREAERNRERQRLKTQELNCSSSSSHSAEFTLGGAGVAVPAAVMQHNAATYHGRSTLSEMGLSKSTQVKITTPNICRRMGTDELEGHHEPSLTPEVPILSKGVFLVPRSSTGSSCAVQEHAKINDATEGDRRIKMDANKSCNVKKDIPPSKNVCFVVGPYGCGVCSRSFGEVDALFSHVMACPWPKPSRCGLCSKPCANWGVVRDHLAAHVKIDAVKCPLCGNAFGKYWSIRRHIQHYHVPFRPFVCNCCDSTFMMKSEISNHSRQCRARTHLVDKYLGSSEKCDSQARSHLATAVYRCSICPSAFLDSSMIARHMRVHLNQVQQIVGGEVQKKHSFDCSNDRSCDARPPTVGQGLEAEASAKCFIGIDVADRTTCCEAISKATQAELSSSTVSRWTQCDDLEDFEDTL